MNRHWKLRDELYNLFHRWPSMLAAIIIGCLLGLGLSYIWPSHYRATSQIYLALNPYRKFSDTLFEALANPKYSNLDNYHYWQMSQLEAAIYMDIFIQPTLEKLRMQDPYWNTVDLDQLRSMLNSEWRSTGNWNLIANHPDSLRASQAASAWSDVVIQKVAEAVDAARRTFMIDQQLQAGETEMLQARLRIQELMSTRSSLQAWQNTVAGISPTEPLDQEARWQLLSLVTPPARFTPAWVAFLDDQPADGAPLHEYQSWIEQIQPLLQSEITALEERIHQIDQQQIDLAGQYSIVSKDSLSFSPNIEVERKEDLGARAVRPTVTFILIGGTIGLLIWLLIQLVIISRSWKNR